MGEMPDQVGRRAEGEQFVHPLVHDMLGIPPHPARLADGHLRQQHPPEGRVFGQVHPDEGPGPGPHLLLALHQGGEVRVPDVGLCRGPPR